MKKIFTCDAILMSALIAISFSALSQTNEGVWTWIHGDSAQNAIPNYGIKGVSAPNNTPGARSAHVTWTDNDGKLWLFGGQPMIETGGGISANDLWKYDPLSNEWTWMSGSNLQEYTSVYNDPNPQNNRPSGRLNAIKWLGADGNLWLYGGYHFGPSSSLSFHALSDLWKYEIASNTWVLVSDASSLGINLLPIHDGPTATPGSLQGSLSWTDPEGNLWLFCGSSWITGGNPKRPTYTAVRYSDLWKYDPVLNQWFWIKGPKQANQPAIYQSTDPSLIQPADKGGAVSWSVGNTLWLFSGANQNDVWKYDITTGNWQWVNGQSSSNVLPDYFSSNPFPGGKSNAVGWKDSEDNVWIYGGSNPVDMWRYNMTSNTWTLIYKSELAETPPHYKIKGYSGIDIYPGSRAVSEAWVDAQNNFWMYGGRSPKSEKRGDLWKFIPLCSNNDNTITINGSNVKCDLSGGNITGTVASGYTWQSSHDNVNYTDIDGATAQEYNAPAVSQTNFYRRLIPSSGICPANISNVLIFTTPPVTPSISPSGIIKLRKGGNTLTSSSTSGNQWYKDGIIINGAINQTYLANQPGSYTVVETTNGCQSQPSVATTLTTSTSIKAIEDALTSNDKSKDLINKIKIAPNPVRDILQIKYDGTDRLHYRIYQVSTNLLIAQGFLTGSKSINISNQRFGTYIIHIKSKTTGAELKQVFIKQY